MFGKAYENQILDEIWQPSVGKHEESGDGAGNAFGVSISLTNVGFSAIVWLVSLFSATASTDKLKLQT